jgi:hypothetical protein
MSIDPRQLRSDEESDDSLSALGIWWNKYGNTLLLVVLVVSLAFLGKRWYENRQNALQEEAWRDLSDSTSPEVYREVAESHDQVAVKALAYLRGADLLLEKATGASGITPSPEDSQQALDEAGTMYQKVLELKDAHKVYRLNAYLGLATLAESRGDLEQAREDYEAVMDQAGAGYGMIVAQAKGRLQMLDRLADPVTFAASPAPSGLPGELPVDIAPVAIPDLQDSLPTTAPAPDSTTPPAPAAAEPQAQPAPWDGAPAVAPQEPAAPQPPTSAQP